MSSDTHTPENPPVTFPIPRWVREAAERDDVGITEAWPLVWQMTAFDGDPHKVFKSRAAQEATLEDLEFSSMTVRFSTKTADGRLKLTITKSVFGPRGERQ